MKGSTKITIENRLRSLGWEEKKCSKCQEPFFTKRDFGECQEEKCSKDLKFLDFSKKRKPVLLNQTQEDIKNFFQRNYLEAKAINVFNEIGNTLFIGAGVQYFEGILFGNSLFPKKQTEKLFIAQPVIRTQFIEDVGFKEGYSTSFVNVCTEEVNASLESHLQSMDNWISCLSKLGLYAKDLTIIVKDKSHDWGAGKFKSIVANFNYGGIQLGDAGYLMNIPTFSGENLGSISDIGFGLERLVWAINKSEHYFDFIDPFKYSLVLDPRLIDSIRTSTLMIMSGTKISNKKQGYRLNQHIKRIYNLSRNTQIDVIDLTNYYYAFWNKFYQPKYNLYQTTESMRIALDKELNKDTYKLLGIKTNGNDPEEYIKKLLLNGVSINSIREKLNQ